MSYRYRRLILNLQPHIIKSGKLRSLYLVPQEVNPCRLHERSIHADHCLPIYRGLPAPHDAGNWPCSNLATILNSANSRRSPDVELMVGRRRRWRATINSTLVQCLAFDRMLPECRLAITRHFHNFGSMLGQRAMSESCVTKYTDVYLVRPTGA